MEPSAPPSKPITIEELLAVIAAQQTQITALIAENTTLKARVVELERRARTG